MKILLPQSSCAPRSSKSSALRDSVTWAIRFLILRLAISGYHGADISPEAASRDGTPRERLNSLLRGSAVLSRQRRLLTNSSQLSRLEFAYFVSFPPNVKTVRSPTTFCFPQVIGF